MSRWFYFLLIAGASLLCSSSAADVESGPPAAPKRRPATRPHILLEFHRALQEKDFSELSNRGVSVLEYVPERRLIVSASDQHALDGMEDVAATAIPPGAKLSGILRSGPGEVSALSVPVPLVVAFHTDVQPAEARALIREQGLEVQEHRDLLANEFLVQAGSAEAAALAEWDEVAFIYAASDDLADGRAVVACPGAMTAWGRAGSLMQATGDGWDGPGTHEAALGYYFGPLAKRLERAAVQNEIARALAEWSRHVRIGFVPSTAAGPRTLSFLFASRGHNDAFPFDGPGRVLAHTYYPAPPNPEPIAGDLHFDEDENWGIGSGIDVYSVALHEIGHALGLGHSDRPGTVMYPYYARLSELSAEDVAAIQNVYAARDDGAVQPSTPGMPSGPRPDSPPPSKPPPGIDTAAPAIALIAPATSSATTFEATISIRGIAQDRSGIAEVTWADSLGNGGAARGTAQWEAGPLPLRIGTNTFTIRARDGAGNTGWRSVVITRRRK